MDSLTLSVFAHIGRHPLLFCGHPQRQNGSSVRKGRSYTPAYKLKKVWKFFYQRWRSTYVDLRICNQYLPSQSTKAI